ncbi:CLUMA_CG014398, isoform A [Clunio marinus]|uniref:CLUMA_CG014398, isoform A n=1 Tax=Clunio marinus TaxID=568069 RepID=A0A1J1IL94_9DIPT|nr:CLUMA_CG014398, isoform A [Clunio marinus]
MAFFSFVFLSVDALKCWRCSSDSTTSAFCDDPFDPSIINDQQRRWAYVDCSFPPTTQQNFGTYQQSSRPVCKKMKQLVNDKVVVSRSCSWEDVNAPADSCMRTQTPSYIKTEFCETCGHDGCNGASTFSVATILVLIPAVIAYFLAL